MRQKPKEPKRAKVNKRTKTQEEEGIVMEKTDPLIDSISCFDVSDKE
jgi:hypothetical protein